MTGVTDGIDMIDGVDVVDPFERLGLDPSASADDVLAARRRLAKQLHPDVGGDGDTMREVNVAVQQALAAIARREGSSSSGPAPAAPAPPAPRRGRDRDGAARGWRVAHDAPSFTVEALPVETFEALLIVTAWMGELLVDDPPYLLEAHLYDPFDCWCRIELVPDAGASSVSIVVAVDDGSLPDVDLVRDELVANLNRLDWSEPGHPVGDPIPPQP